MLVGSFQPGDICQYLESLWLSQLGHGKHRRPETRDALNIPIAKLAQPVRQGLSHLKVSSVEVGTS